MNPNLQIHTKSVTCLAIINEGSNIITGSADGTLKISTLEEISKEIKNFDYNFGSIQSIDFDNNQEIIAVGSADHKVYLVEF